MNLSKSELKLSNLFIVGFEGTQLSKEIAEKLLKLKPAGIILFDTNIESREQVKKLILDLKNLLSENTLISVDQEGGKVERLRKISPSLSSLYALGKMGSGLDSDGKLSKESIANLRTHTRLLALDLIDLGFNLVFAPCADLNSNPDNPIIGTRSLGEDSELLTQQLNVIINELKKHPLLHCVKHFPGHGDARVDSHLALPEIDLSEPEKFNKHISPFKEAIKLNTDSIMVAHALFKFPNRNLEKLPASINHLLIKEFLVQELKFKNLIISDEITMKALSNFGDYESICKQMIKAGNNLIIWNTNIDEALAVYDLDLDANLFDSINASLEKINSFHELLEAREKSYEAPNNIDQEINNLKYKHQERLKKLFRDYDLKDFTSPDLILCFAHHKIENFVLDEIFPNIKIERFNNKSNLSEILAQHRNQKVLVFSFLAFRDPEQRKQINIIKESENKVLEIACDFPDSEAGINLLGFNKTHLKSLR